MVKAIQVTSENQSLPKTQSYKTIMQAVLHIIINIIICLAKTLLQTIDCQNIAQFLVKPNVLTHRSSSCTQSHMQSILLHNCKTQKRQRQQDANERPKTRFKKLQNYKEIGQSKRI